MTDCFQPIEKEYNLTEWLIGQLNMRDMDYLIVTKNASVKDCKTLDPRHAHIQISITSTPGKTPDDDWEHASSPQERLDAVKELYERGFDVQMRLSPFIPELFDIQYILDNPCDKVLVEFLRVNTFIRRNMKDYRQIIPFGRYKEPCGAYKGLSLNQKIAYLKPLFGKKRLTICEDNDEHYQFFLHNINANPGDCCDLRPRYEGWRTLTKK